MEMERGKKVPNKITIVSRGKMMKREERAADFSSLSQHFSFPPIFFNYHGILKEENEFSLFHTCSQHLMKKRLLLLQSWLPCFCERGNKEHFIFVF